MLVMEEEKVCRTKFDFRCCSSVKLCVIALSYLLNKALLKESNSFPALAGCRNGLNLVVHNHAASDMGTAMSGASERCIAFCS